MQIGPCRALTALILTASLLFVGCDSSLTGTQSDNEQTPSATTAQGPPGGTPAATQPGVKSDVLGEDLALKSTGENSATKRAQGTAPAGKSPVKITVMEDSAPNIFGSSNFVSWLENAWVGIRTNGRAGDPDTPAYFEDMQNAEPKHFVATNFTSWMGQADPGDAFGSAFENELGNRMHWVTRVVDPTGGKVNITDGLTLAYEPNPLRPNGYTATFGQYGAIPTAGGPAVFIAGIKYGNDGEPGGGDDVVLGSGTGEVDEIITAVPGVANAALCSGCTVDEQQEAIDQTIADIEALGKFQFKFTASFRGKTTRSVLNVNRSGNGKSVSARSVDERR